jgi:hypothetical protein
MKEPSNYKGKRITLKTIVDYIAQKYGATPVIQKEYIIDDFRPLLQEDYGGDNDCTLTSITACVNYYSKNIYDINSIYNFVEKIAKRHLYRANIGTNPLFIQCIYNQTLKKFPNSRRKITTAKYLKDVGFNFNAIKSAINKKHPVVLSLWDDGRKYYSNHSITVIGYQEYKVGKKVIKILVVYDNWTREKCCVDYGSLSTICSANY